ncbi:hypothetical protein SAMN05444521_8180 [Streptomyces sp. 3214.6]|nr:hypothetical protein SAMN05444521_8180 [Streptomyces sp. 3214.6]
MAEQHRHCWARVPGDPHWEECGSPGCDQTRHCPIRESGDASHCPNTEDGQHQWQPVSFRFETQLLDERGRVEIRQPSIDEGRVYAVCMPCRSHTYIVTAWVGYFLGYPFIEEEEARRADA